MSFPRTPGPWEARRDGYRRNPTIFGSDGSPVCSCGGNAPGFGAYSRETQERRNANARLIEAAPDLLAAVKRLLEMHAAHRDHWAHKEALKFVDKAEGR